MKKTLKTILLGLILTSGVVTSCTTENNTELNTGEVLLRYNPTSGDEYVSKMSMNSKMDGSQSMNMDLDFDMITTISDVKENKSYTTSNNIKRVVLNMKMKEMKIVYDSDLKVQEGMGVNMDAVYSKFINLDLKYKMSNRGEILALPDLNELFGGNNAAKDQFSQTSDMLKNSNIQFPEEAVKVGSTWDMNIESEEDEKSETIVKTTYTVKEIKENEVVLTFAGDINMNSDSIKNIGDISGESIVDRESGFLKKMDMVQKMEMFIMGKDIKLVSKMNMTMTKK